MSQVQLNFGPAIDQMSSEDYRKLLRILEACGPETAVPDIRPLYQDLIKNLGTFGSCVVATALFVAARNRNGERWTPMLVEDPEFPPDHALRTHWVAKNLDEDEAPAIDVTVADQEKSMLALGSDAEMDAVSHYAEDASLLQRLQAGLDQFADEDGRPLLPQTTAKDLLQIYRSLLSQPERPRRLVRVTPFAVLVDE